jgi:hypothetical protein
MTDIATALSNALKNSGFDDDDTAAPPTMVESPTANSKTGELFEYIKNNPGKTVREIVLATRCDRPSLIYQMVEQGRLIGEGSPAVFRANPEYVRGARRKRPVDSPPKPAAAAPVATPRITADSVLETLSVAQAYSLYLELHKMFGGRNG